MNKCIYLKDNQELSYNKKEHIISAAIGGVTCLDHGVVSDQANEILSKIELHVFRESPMSLNRIFFGPGKRGSLSKKKTTKSKVQVFSGESVEDVKLGYIENGCARSIPQIIAIDEKITVKFDKESSLAENQMTEFQVNLRKFDNTYIKLENRSIDDNVNILGWFSGRWYLYSNCEMEHSWNQVINKVLELDISPETAEISKSDVIVNAPLVFDPQLYYRVIAKTAFNAFAYIYSHEIALKDTFDSIRSWIINGGSNEFVQIYVPSDSSLIESTNIKSHIITFSKVDSHTLVAHVRLYGNYAPNCLVILSEEYTDEIMPNGFVCDWENKCDGVIL